MNGCNLGLGDGCVVNRRVQVTDDEMVLYV